MTLLLDTHAFIWFINGDDKLSEPVKKLIADIANQCYISVASLWEIAIKSSLNKLELVNGFDKIADFLEENVIEVLPVEFEHLQYLIKLPLHHRDPFDRLIIAQAVAEDFTLVTQDTSFKNYQVKTIF